MNTPAQFSEARRKFHATLLKDLLTINSKGIVSNADGSNRASIAIIPVGQVHALENPGNISLELIEVQSGSYLGEDDIVRIEDRYGRN